MSTLPKVSCLLVTADRPALCRRAVRSYQRQTYLHTELVVLDNGAEPMKPLLEGLPEQDIVYLREEPSSARTIGALRNRALEAATGAFVVPQWDDDDWSHPERIKRQVEVLQRGCDACTLSGYIVHLESPDYFERPFIGRMPTGTCLMHRRDSGIRFPDLRRTSDTPYIQEWRQRRSIQLPLSASHLYVRHFHGDNLWDEAHILRRMRNTPKDLLLYGWHRWVRGNLFDHPRFQLSDDAQRAFAMYLRDSLACGLFTEQAVTAAIAA